MRGLVEEMRRNTERIKIEIGRTQWQSPTAYVIAERHGYIIPGVAGIRGPVPRQERLCVAVLGRYSNIQARQVLSQLPEGYTFDDKGANPDDERYLAHVYKGDYPVAVLGSKSLVFLLDEMEADVVAGLAGALGVKPRPEQERFPSGFLEFIGHLEALDHIGVKEKK